MPIQEILRDLISKASVDPGGTTNLESHETNFTDVSPGSLVLVLESECNSGYKDTGNGLHFVGVLLTVFAAEVISAYWERNAQMEDVKSERGPAMMLSCLYSRGQTVFVLCHPSDVISASSE